MAHRPSLQWSSECRTDRGPVRPVNEDACVNRPEIGVWAVADGMGGHHAGDYASSTIVRALEALHPGGHLPQRLQQVQRALEHAHHTIAAEGRRRQRTIASTVVAMVAWGGEAACLWAGDSRLYRCRRGRLTCLTRDHTLAQEQIAQGLIDPGAADKLPGANVLTRGVGAHDALRLSTEPVTLEPGDRFLLCSDGLYRALSSVTIARAIARSEPVSASAVLIDLAVRHGADDNVTVVVVHCA